MFTLVMPNTQTSINIQIRKRYPTFIRNRGYITTIPYINPKLKNIFAIFVSCTVLHYRSKLIEWRPNGKHAKIHQILTMYIYVQNNRQKSNVPFIMLP